MATMIDRDTVQKFDVPGPRYTSYPTAPTWSAEVGELEYIERLQKLGTSDKTLSLYIHIPFCQSLCSFCACNVVIRKKDEKYGDEYLDYLFKEIDLVREYMGTAKTVRQLHWGGGTPTFLSERQIRRLFEKIEDSFDLQRDGEIAIEIDPRTIDASKIETLRAVGFNRVSMGIQDFDPEVQASVNRIQPFEQVKRYYEHCRSLGFHSVNFDLIYGLPGQTPETFDHTMRKVIDLKPDRIALYSFAYVPWLKKHQSKIHKDEMPAHDVKLDLFLSSRDLLLKAGYESIAMDHFALKDDELARSFGEGELYRNFMGYTVKPADEFLGLGITAIGFLETTYVQNFKTLKEYFGSLRAGQLPVERGKVLTRDDQVRQFVINSLMCRFQIDKVEFNQRFNVQFDEYFLKEQTHLTECVDNGLIAVENERFQLTELGKIFVRNVCMGFDRYLTQKKSYRKFSQTV